LSSRSRGRRIAVRITEAEAWKKDTAAEALKLQTIDDVLHWFAVKVLNLRRLQRERKIDSITFQKRYDRLIDYAKTCVYDHKIASESLRREIDNLGGMDLYEPGDEDSH
jgi:hypothetical protein